MLRLFFALPCPPMTATRIDAWRQQQHFAGRPVPMENLHLTLAFIGLVAQSRLASVIALPQQLPLHEQAFTLHLDQLACWPDGLLHLAPSRPPSALLILAHGLQRLLIEGGLVATAPDYRPHLTLSRCSRPAETGNPPSFSWLADELALYHSTEGGYRPLARWSLGQSH